MLKMLGNHRTIKRCRIKELREDWSLSQKQFGELIGKSRRTVQDYEGDITEVPESIDRLLDYIERDMGGRKRGS